jgi:hypothetical protein
VPHLSQSREVSGLCDVFDILKASISVSIRRRAGADRPRHINKGSLNCLTGILKVFRSKIFCVATVI